MKRPIPKRPRRLRSFKTSLYLIGAAAIGMFAFLFAAFFRPQPVSSKPLVPEAAPDGEQAMVLIPTPVRTIARGEKLSMVPFQKTKWPKSQLHGNYIMDEAEYAAAAALAPLPAHLPVPVSAVAPGGGDANAVVESISAGLRAITVRVDAESAVEGWARSGNYVDVIVLRQSADRDVGIEAKVIAENVRILSAGRSTQPVSGESAPNAPPTITLLVTQEDALKIKTAANVGKLTFALRGTGDQLPTVSLEMNQRALLGSAKSFVPRKKIYTGKATGPDGKTYLLSDDARWVRAPEMEEPPLPEKAAPEKPEDSGRSAGEMEQKPAVNAPHGARSKEQNV
ncbi:MAG TPA: Flp pilus assembly protein CpaB [Oligoflexia bacterium]|nr:Flp pilus assembly protein CpaB [Oligoflexia bacterium]